MTSRQFKKVLSKKQIPKKDVLRIQDMLQNKTQVGTVNFRLYSRVMKSTTVHRPNIPMTLK